LQRAGQEAPCRAVRVEALGECAGGLTDQLISPRAERVERLERPELPAEAPAHGAVDTHRIVRDLRSHLGGIAEPGAEQVAQEVGRRIALGGQQQGEALPEVALVACHLDVC
jgi:hypothetical protein